MKKTLGLKISLFINYFVFAILLNSVGIVIARVLNNYGVDEAQASILEAFKDLPIAGVSFLVGSMLPKLGFKKGMLIGLVIVFFGCLAMYFGNDFWAAKVLFATVGVSFAIIKVATYALIGQVTTGEKEHMSFMSTIESVFMIGIAVAYFLFPLFFSDTDQDAWLRIYLLLAGLVAVAFLFLLFSTDEIKQDTGSSLKEDIKQSFVLLKDPLLLAFGLFAFFYVMTEQGIMTWLPSFNEQVLQFSDKLSVFMASILALSIAAGRFIAGQLVKKIHWLTIVIVCLICAAVLLIIVLPQMQNMPAKEISHIRDVPWPGFVFPLIGLFLAPLYPLVASTVLSAVKKILHSPVAGILTLFSALGGTMGSRIIGELFKDVGGEKAFYFLLIPLSILILVLFILNNKANKNQKQLS